MVIMRQIVGWMSASDVHYWIIAGPSMLAVISLAGYSLITGFRQSPGEQAHAAFLSGSLPFVTMVAWTLIAFRWPAVLYPLPLNPDESGRVVEAMKLFGDDVIPWRSIDTGTSGPLNAYILILPALLGLPLDYATARIVGLLCTFGTILFTFLAVRTVTNDGIAKMTIVPMLIFYCFTRFYDFIHYTSEHLSIVLLAGALFVIVQYAFSAQRRGARLFLSSLLLGAVPFAKLQATPAAATLYVASVVFLIRRGNALGTPFGWRESLYCSGIGVLPAVFAVMLLWGHAFEDFWISYVVNNLLFVSGKYVMPLSAVIHSFVQPGIFIGYLSGNIVLWLTSAVAAAFYRLFSRQYATHLYLSVCYLLVTVYIVLKPGRDHFHYLLYLVAPLALVAGVLAGNIALTVLHRYGRRPAAAVMILAAGIIVAHQVPAEREYYAVNPLLASAADYFAADPWSSLAPDVSVATEAILSVAHPGEKMAIWGCTPEFYVSTGLLPGTPDATIENMILDSSLQKYYRERFLRFLIEERPPVFVDSVTSRTFYDRNKYAHETFRGLADFVEGSYSLTHVVGHDKEDAVRIYVLNERVTQKRNIGERRMPEL